MGLEPVGRLLILVGGVILLAGVALGLGDRIPLIGRLPGDIRIERDGTVILIPLGTMLVVSVVLSLVLGLVGRGR